MSGTRGLGLFARMVQSFGFALERRFGEAYRNASGYRKLGLLREDLLAETPNVTEAIRRLPSEVREARARRILVALDCSLKNKELPSEQWITPEQDKLYLAPYLKEIYEEKLYRQNYRL